jgi:hypothetical protein
MLGNSCETEMHANPPSRIPELLAALNEGLMPELVVDDEMPATGVGVRSGCSATRASRLSFCTVPADGAASDRADPARLDVRSYAHRVS